MLHAVPDHVALDAVCVCCLEELVHACRYYPYGLNTIMELRKMNPPPVNINISIVKQQPTGTYHCKLVITRLPDSGLSQATDSPFTLICGCANTDELLLWRHMKLETFESPMEVGLALDFR
jgi:hypothetical protein